MASEAEEAGGAAARRRSGPRWRGWSWWCARSTDPAVPVEHDLEVTRLTPSATVGDLVDAVAARLAPAGDRPDRAVVIDGVPVTLDRPLRSSGLRRGSVLSLSEHGRRQGRGR